MSVLETQIGFLSEADSLKGVSRQTLLHDVVEIDAGDTFVDDETGLASTSEREEKAAKRLFADKPRFRGLWAYAEWLLDESVRLGILRA